MPALDALLSKAEFAEAFTSAHGRTQLEAMAQAFAEESDSDLTDLHPTPAEHVTAWERRCELAELFYVDPRMCDVVTAAAPTMPAETLEAADLPATHGFVLIPGGIGQIDTFGLDPPDHLRPRRQAGSTTRPCEETVVWNLWIPTM